MKKFYIYVLLSYVINFSWALEVRIEKAYYDVAPTSAEEVYQQIILSSPFNHDDSESYQTIGGYEASTIIKKMDLVYADGFCHAETFEMTLNGLITLPRLKMDNYSLKIRQAFEEQLQYLEEHEKVHEEIWKEHLAEFEREIKSSSVQDNESCEGLIDEINQKMVETLDAIMTKNIQFDCISYGKRLDMMKCQ